MNANLINYTGLLGISTNYYKNYQLMYWSIIYYLLGTGEQVEKAYIAIRSRQVSVNSLWKAIKVSSIGCLRSNLVDIGVLFLLPYKNWTHKEGFYQCRIKTEK